MACLFGFCLARDLFFTTLTDQVAPASGPSGNRFSSDDMLINRSAAMLETLENNAFPFVVIILYVYVWSSSV